MNKLLSGVVALLSALGSWLLARAIEPSTYAGLALAVASVDGGKLSALLNQIGPYAPYIAGALGIAGMAASTSGSTSGSLILADIETVIKAVATALPTAEPAKTASASPEPPLVVAAPAPAIAEVVKAIEAVAAPYIPPAGDPLAPPATLAPETVHAL